MERIKDLTNFMIVLVNVGSVVRIIYCFIITMTSVDEKDSYKKKISNLLIFLVLANTATALSKVIIGYFT